MDSTPCPASDELANRLRERITEVARALLGERNHQATCRRA